MYPVLGLRSWTVSGNEKHNVDCHIYHIATGNSMVILVVKLDICSTGNINYQRNTLFRRSVTGECLYSKSVQVKRLRSFKGQHGNVIWMTGDLCYFVKKFTLKTRYKFLSESAEFCCRHYEKHFSNHQFTILLKYLSLKSQNNPFKRSIGIACWHCCRPTSYFSSRSYLALNLPLTSRPNPSASSFSLPIVLKRPRFLLPWV